MWRVAGTTVEHLLWWCGGLTTMRIPLPATIGTRDTATAKDAVIRNGYVDESMVCNRPGVTDWGSLGAAGQAQILGICEGVISVVGDVASSLDLSANPATPTTVTGFSPVTADLDMSWEANGIAQDPRQMLVKSAEQGWVYTP